MSLHTGIGMPRLLRGLSGIRESMKAFFLSLSGRRGYSILIAKFFSDYDDGDASFFLLPFHDQCVAADCVISTVRMAHQVSFIMAG